MRSKVIFSTLSLVFASAITFGQLEHTTWWCFGIGGGVEFTGGAPVGFNGAMTSVNEGTTNMSDAAGNHLFYSDGLRVWDANHNQMPNGFGLMGSGTSTQSSVCVPDPGNPNQYYLFTVMTGGSGLRYSKVDMTLNAGNGDVVAAGKNTLLFSPVHEKLCATHHANMVDYWVLVHQASSPNYLAFLVTAAGVSGPVTSSCGPSLNGAIGYMTITSCGSRIGTSNYDPTLGVSDFDNATGVVSNYMDLNFGSNYSSGFSPNGDLFYHWSYTPVNEIYQLDLTAGNAAAVNATRWVAATQGSWYGAFQPGRDGKLYTLNYSTNFLHVFNNPDVYGAGCNFQANAVAVNGNTQLGLPNFLNSYFQAAFCNVVLGVDLYDFKGELTQQGNLLKWTTGSETKSDYFVLERSIDAENYGPIGTIDGAGYSSELIDYEFLDSDPHPGINYYRLKQVDFNGNSETSDVILLRFGRPPYEVAHVNVNAENQLLRVANNFHQPGQLFVYDLAGNQVMQVALTDNLNEFSVSHLSSGIYIYDVSSSARSIKHGKILIP